MVTGSTDGIGREFALQLAKRGFNIILAARNADKLAATRQAILKEASGAKVETVQVDFSSASVEALIRSVRDKKITVLVNNVGISHEHPEYFVEAAPSAIDAILNINIRNTLHLTQAILPQMIERRQGLVLNLGSFSAETPLPLLQTYGASKAFLKHWSQSLAAEVAAQGVQVQLLNTYFVVSNLSKRKRPSLLIPTPAAYVRAAMRLAGSSDFETPYPSHALLYLLMGFLPTGLLTLLNLAQMRAVRQIALQKAKRA